MPRIFIHRSVKRNKNKKKNVIKKFFQQRHVYDISEISTVYLPSQFFPTLVKLRASTKKRYSFVVVVFFFLVCWTFFGD
jgi:hypothetical protein